MTCAWFCSDSLLKSSVRTNRCSQTWTKHGQHEVEAVALQQGTVDGKSPRLQHPGTLLSGRCRLEARLTRAEGDGGALLTSVVTGLVKMAKPECCALKSEKHRSNSFINRLSFVAKRAHEKTPGNEAEIL